MKPQHWVTEHLRKHEKRLSFKNHLETARHGERRDLRKLILTQPDVKHKERLHLVVEKVI